VSTKKTSKDPTMAELLASAKGKVVGFSSGQKVKGKVLAKDRKSLILDIGGKSEGQVSEKAFAEVRDFVKGLKVGDEVWATVLVPETKDGVVLLSLRGAAQDASWGKLTRIQKTKESIYVLGRGVNPSGVTVEVEGLLGFIPQSQLGKVASKNPQELIGKYFKAQIIEVGKSVNKVVLSEKEVSEASDIRLEKEASEKVKEGEIYDGVITTVANFGCFVKIGVEVDKKKVFVEGLVHISELSWSKVKNPSDIYSEGDKVKIKAIGLKGGKLSFSIKAAEADPWEKADAKYKPESKVSGIATKVSDFGVFVEVEPGIEGLIHTTKIPPGKRLREGEKVNCYVENIDTKARKLSLGLVLTSKPIGYK